MNKHDFPPISNHQIYIFLIKDSPHIDNMFISRCLETLSGPEKEKYTRFHFDKDRRIFLLSRALLRFSLAAYGGGDPGDVAFEAGAHGKPCLKDNANITFNLTHSHGAAALALAVAGNADIGIDIEGAKSHRDFLEMGLRYFSQDECKLLRNCRRDNQQKLFYRLWTLKEAYIKAIGKGLSIDLSSFAFEISEDGGISVNHFGNEVERNKEWSFLQAEVYERHMLALAIRAESGPRKGYDVQAFEFVPGAPCKPFVLRAVSYSGPSFH